MAGRAVRQAGDDEVACLRHHPPADIEDVARQELRRHRGIEYPPELGVPRADQPIEVLVGHSRDGQLLRGHGVASSAGAASAAITVANASASRVRSALVAPLKCATIEARSAPTPASCRRPLSADFLQASLWRM